MTRSAVAAQLLALGVLLLLSAHASPARSEEAPFSIKGFSEREQELFLEGIGQALTVYNLNVELQGNPRLFCPPANLRLNAKTVWELANSALTGPHRPEIVSVAVLDELRRRFSCTPKSAEEAELERQKELLTMLNELEGIIDRRTKERYAACLQAGYGAPFCKCLNDKIGWQIDFATYKEIASKSAADLNRDSLPEEERQLVDHVHQVRTECSKARQ